MALHVSTIVIWFCYDGHVTADKTAGIQAAWKQLLIDLVKKPAKMKMAFVARAKGVIHSTLAYRSKVGFSAAQLDQFWDIASLKIELKHKISRLMKDQVIQTITAKTGVHMQQPLCISHA